MSTVEDEFDSFQDLEDFTGPLGYLSYLSWSEALAQIHNIMAKARLGSGQEKKGRAVVIAQLA